MLIATVGRVVSHFFRSWCPALMTMLYENRVRFLLKLQIFPLHYTHFTFSISKVGSAVSELSHTQKTKLKKELMYLYLYLYLYLLCLRVHQCEAEMVLGLGLVYFYVTL
jgi:hypothetical protein